MGLGGIIAGALGGGAQAVGQIADTQIKQNNWVEQAQVEQRLAIEREEAIARRRAQIARDDTLERATGPIADAELALRARQGAVDNATATEREGTVGRVRGQVERENAAAYATPEGAGALRGLKAKANSSESDSIVGSRAASTEGQRIANTTAREEQDLVRKARELRNRGDEEGAAKVEAQIGVGRPGKGGKGGAGSDDPKSGADAVAAAKVFLELAKGAEETGDMAGAQAFRAKAAEVAGGVAERRKVVPKGEPTPGGGPKEGATGMSKSGKPIVYQNGQWVYK